MSDSNAKPAAGQQPMRIVIVGAGIAGLAAAIALRSDNRDITILESSPMALESGAAIGSDYSEVA